MRRATTWILILALVLLALCVLWLLPRLLRPQTEEPLDAGSAVAASGRTEADGAPAPPAPPAVASPTSAPTTTKADARGEAPSREVEDAEDHPPLPCSLVGRLVDRTDRPVPGATVLAAHAPELGTPIVRSEWWIAHLPLEVADPGALGAEAPARTTSDAAGRFALEGLEPGRVRFAVRSEKLAPLDQGDLRLAAGECLELGDLLLEPPAQIYGTLEDDAGRPVSGAPIVEVDDFTEAWLPPLDPSAGVRLAVTDLRGGFQSRPFVVGPWRARALGGTILVDATMRGASPAEGWNRFETMAEAGWLRGMLSTHGSVAEDLLVRALPAENARSSVPFACRADARQGRVQRNGAFAVEGLAPGVLYEFRAGASNQRFEDESLWSPPTFAAAFEEDVRVRWEPDATVSFALVDAADHTSVATCEVELGGALPALSVLGAPAPARAGLRVLEGVRPLRSFPGASLRAASRGFSPLLQRLDLRPGKDASLGSLSMSPLPTLAVRVADALTGAPLKGALVTASDSSTGRDPSDLAPQAVATDAAGAARVAAFAGAGSRIEVRARGHARQRRLGPFGGGFSTPRLEVRLPRGATARIHVVDSAGHAMSGARVEWIEGSWSPNEASPGPDVFRIRDRPGAETSSIADADGLVTFSHLAPGRHAFRVQRWATILDGEWTQRDLADGEEAEIELQGPARTSLDVRIADEGAPLAGAPVVLLRRSSVDSLLAVAEIENALPPGIDARLDTAGAHTFSNLDPGAHVLAFAVPGQRLRGCREVRLREGPNRLALDLASTAVSGRVSKGGRPAVPGSKILLSEPTRDRELRETFRRRGWSGSTTSDLISLALDHDATVADANGEFRLLGLPIGEPFAILALDEACGFGKSEPLVLREESGTGNADITVLPAGALEIHATTLLVATPLFLFAIPSDRHALPRIRRVFPGRSELLNALEPGAWDIQLADGSTRTRDRRRVEVVAGETRTVELSLP